MRARTGLREGVLEEYALREGLVLGQLAVGLHPSHEVVLLEPARPPRVELVEEGDARLDGRLAQVRVERGPVLALHLLEQHRAVLVEHARRVVAPPG